MRLDITKLTLDHELQPRESIDMAVVAEYAEAMKDGARFPPVVVFFDGSEYLLVDGFHRVYAARQLHQVSIEADVRRGTAEDARWHSYGVNKSHGLRRTNLDKRRAVEHALAHPNAATMSDSQIARHVGVTHKTISAHRQAILGNSQDTPAVRIVTRNGSTYELDVSNIGRREAFEFDRPVALATFGTEPPQTQSDPPPKAGAAVYTLADWAGKSETERTSILRNAIASDTSSRFNRQETDNIEWARWSWNPVTGCKHNCIYCYARDIANRFYAQKFEPAIIPERLATPRMMIPPPEAEHAIGYKNVFTCSMADLFGRWVPQDWIDAVFSVVKEATRWNFLFLTKFPLRLAEQNWPDNAWIGTSVDSQSRVDAAERAFSKVKGGIKWLSCEPLLEPLQFKSLSMFDWIVIGGQTASSQAPEFQPKWAWVEKLVNQARHAGCQVYFKTNLHARPLEYPGGDK